MSCSFRRLVSLSIAALLVGRALPLSAQDIAEKELPKPNAALKDGLKSAQWVRALPDGRVLVIDIQGKKIVVADLTSGKLETRMSEGADDNDFILPGPLWTWPGDSAATYDAGKSRLMIFGPDGSLARTQWVGPPARPGVQNPVVAARGLRLPTVRFLIGTDMVVGTGTSARAPAPSSPAAAPVRMPFPILRVSLRTLRPDTVVTLMPVQLPRAPLNPQSNGGNLKVFVGTSPLQSVDAWAAFSDGTVAVVRAASYRVEWFPLVGEHVFTDAVPYTPIPVTKDDKKRVVDEYRRVGEQVLSSHPMRAQILAVTYEEPPTWPATHPPFRGDIAAMVDPQDRIWLLTRCVKDEQAVCYDVIDRSGARAERYRLPAKTRVVGFGAGVVYTAFEQKSDKEVLQRHPLS